MWDRWIEERQGAPRAGLRYRRIEDCYLRWLRTVLHLAAAGALVVSVLAALLMALGIAGWLVGGPDKDMGLLSVFGGAGVLEAAALWAGAVFSLLTLRTLRDWERKLRGEPLEGQDQDAL
ncbi:hypothetical protein [Nitrospira calida]|jgi:hypothetical protein